MKRIFLITLLVMFVVNLGQAEEARLLRFPDVSADRVAFVYAGDIYTAPRTGGQATRLTSHPGLELFPKFSPDGSKIAFTGEYDGDEAVYVIPVTGGQPQRLTWHPGIQDASPRFGPENLVLGWHPDGTRVLFRSRKEGLDIWEGRVYMVDLDGGLPEPLPMKSAGFTSLSPDLKWAAYCPIFRDFRTWKRYKGGMAQDVWLFNLETFESEKITDWQGTDNKPMWYEGMVYFNSDRTERLNLHVYDTASGATRQVTEFTDYDVRWPSLGSDGIAFEKGGYIYVMDLPSEDVNKVSIDLIYDYHGIRPDIKDVSDQISEFDIAPNGKRAVFAARGDLFSVPIKEGNTRQLINRSTARESSPQWSPDGMWVAFHSDISGEQELYLVSHDAADTVQLTDGSLPPRSDPSWSPDSKKLAWFDITGGVRLVDIGTGEITMLDSAVYGGLGGPSWSPDSRFLAYNKSLENRIRTLFVYSFDDGASYQVTPGFTNDYWPAFSPDGKYLYFVSQRDFNPILSDYEFEFVNQAIENLFVILLQDEGESPFHPGTDEAVEAESDEKKEEDDDKGKDKDADSAVHVEIDFDGIFEREVQVDLPSGNYSSLRAVDGAMFYMSSPIWGLRGEVVPGERVLHKYDIEKEEDHEFASGVRGFTLSPDGKHMLLSKGGSYYIIGTGGKQADLSEGALSLAHLETQVDYRQEYAQMFREVWRGTRDRFYDANMHGVDWNLMWDKYAVMLPHVTHRFDLIYLMGEMVSELACSHTYIGGGDMPSVPAGKVGLLGVDFAVDTAADRIRIERILPGENFDPSLQSPLREPGIDVREGDYLLAINGQPISGAMNPYRFTENTLGQHISITVNDRPTMEGARTVEVEPIAKEEPLRYYAFAEGNRRYVDSVSGGKIGYIHIPDMSSYGLYRFTKMFYHQMRKPGLIIDVRWNGGGFVSGLILERLRRVLAGMGKGRYGTTWRDPGGAIYAHMITLQNEFSCSDGDIFPYFFGEYDLGPRLGKRTWGGVIGISGFTRLVDGGYYTVPGFGMYNLEGDWVVENEGVHPDIEVENRPERLVAGYDDQLDRAIENIQKRLEEDPKNLPEVNGPPAPR